MTSLASQRSARRSTRLNQDQDSMTPDLTSKASARTGNDRKRAVKLNILQGQQQLPAHEDQANPNMQPLNPASISDPFGDTVVDPIALDSRMIQDEKTGNWRRKRKNEYPSAETLCYNQIKRLRRPLSISFLVGKLVARNPFLDEKSIKDSLRRASWAAYNYGEWYIDGETPTPGHYSKGIREFLNEKLDCGQIKSSDWSNLYFDMVEAYKTPGSNIPRVPTLLDGLKYNSKEKSWESRDVNAHPSIAGKRFLEFFAGFNNITTPPLDNSAANEASTAQTAMPNNTTNISSSGIQTGQNAAQGLSGGLADSYSVAPNLPHVNNSGLEFTSSKPAAPDSNVLASSSGVREKPEHGLSISESYNMLLFPSALPSQSNGNDLSGQEPVLSCPPTPEITGYTSLPKIQKIQESKPCTLVSSPVKSNLPRIKATLNQEESTSTVLTLETNIIDKIDSNSQNLAASASNSNSSISSLPTDTNSSSQSTIDDLKAPDHNMVETAITGSEKSELHDTVNNKNMSFQTLNVNPALPQSSCKRKAPEETTNENSLVSSHKPGLPEPVNNENSAAISNDINPPLRRSSRKRKAAHPRGEMPAPQQVENQYGRERKRIRTMRVADENDSRKQHKRSQSKELAAAKKQTSNELCEGKGTAKQDDKAGRGHVRANDEEATTKDESEASLNLKITNAAEATDKYEKNKERKRIRTEDVTTKEENDASRHHKRARITVATEGHDNGQNVKGARKEVATERKEQLVRAKNIISNKEEKRNQARTKGVTSSKEEESKQARTKDITSRKEEESKQADTKEMTLNKEQEGTQVRKRARSEALAPLEEQQSSQDRKRARTRGVTSGKESKSSPARKRSRDT